jgi:hypothetical protein
MNEGPCCPARRKKYGSVLLGIQSRWVSVYGGPTGRNSVAPQQLPDAVSIAPYFIEDVLKLSCSSRLLSQSARPGKILCGVLQLPELARECCPPCCLTSASSARVAVYMTRLPELDALRKKVVCSGDEGVPSTM